VAHCCLAALEAAVWRSREDLAVAHCARPGSVSAGDSRQVCRARIARREPSEVWVASHTTTPTSMWSPDRVGVTCSISCVSSV
jgi:hypothetical protein